jgi:ATP-dependent Clp endopeptidase proteolytic subunit ClpP
MRKYTLGNRKRCAAEQDDDSTTDDVLIRTHDNMVFFNADVTKESALALITTLLEVKDTLCSNGMYKKTIWLFIHSDGGDLHAGLSVMDHIQNLGIRVCTVIDGFVASAATLIFLAGSKRYVMPHGNILIHQLSTEFWGKYEELQDELANSENLMRTIEDIYREHTSIPHEQVRSLLRRELYLSADKCLEYKIAHKVYGT